MTKIINYQGSMDALVWHKEKKSLTAEWEVVVPFAHEAVFVRDGEMTDTFAVGIHLLGESAVGDGRLFRSRDESVDCVVYYVKKEGTYNVKWSLPSPVTLIDPILRIPVEIDLAGVFAIKIINSKQFLARLLTFTKKVNLEEVKAFFRERMILYIKDQLLAVLCESKTSAAVLNRGLIAVSKNLELKMRYVFESFGVSVEGVELKKADVLNIKLPDAGSAEQNECSPAAAETVAQGKGEVMYCGKCGAGLPPLSNFCFNCGEKIQS